MRNTMGAFGNATGQYRKQEDSDSSSGENPSRQRERRDEVRDTGYNFHDPAGASSKGDMDERKK
jgi:hypothetical protein